MKAMKAMAAMKAMKRKRKDDVIDEEEEDVEEDEDMDGEALGEKPARAKPTGDWINVRGDEVRAKAVVSQLDVGDALEFDLTCRVGLAGPAVLGTFTAVPARTPGQCTSGLIFCK